MPSRGPSIVAIAEAAGVSKTTVSSALHGRGRVAEATREKVLAVAREMGYRPNRMARSLRTRRTGTVGLVFSHFDTLYFTSLLSAVESAVSRQGLHLVVGASQASPQKEQDLLEVLLEHGVDGLLVAPLDQETNADYFKALQQQGVPLVMLDTYLPRVPCDAAVTDNRRGGYLAGRRFAELGRRQWALLGRGVLERVTSFRHRVEGYEQAAREAGVAQPARLSAGELSLLPREYERAGYRAMQAYLESGAGLDALFALDDPMAQGAMRALREAGRAVPGEVAVIGHDDLPMSEFSYPPLASIHQPVPAMGEQAVALLLERIAAGGQNGQEPRRVFLEPSLVVRESCAG